MEDKTNARRSQLLFQFNPEHEKEAPAICNLPEGPARLIYQFLLPYDQHRFSSVNRRHHRWFLSKNALTYERFNQEKSRVLTLIEKYKQQSLKKHIVHANFIPLLTEVFGVEKNAFHRSGAFEWAVIEHARQLTPRNEWYTLVPYEKPVRNFGYPHFRQ